MKIFMLHLSTREYKKMGVRRKCSLLLWILVRNCSARVCNVLVNVRLKKKTIVLVEQLLICVLSLKIRLLVQVSKKVLISPISKIGKQNVLKWIKSIRLVC